MKNTENTKRDSLINVIEGSSLRANELRGGVVKYYRTSFESAGIHTQRLNESEAEMLSQQVGAAFSELKTNTIRL
ncbi:MAG: hypothetical protein ACTSXQ_00310 [Alphaproteobacteria bacterium]